MKLEPSFYVALYLGWGGACILGMLAGSGWIDKDRGFYYNLIWSITVCAAWLLSR